MASFHRRRLPHYHSVGRPIFLTWRLPGSLPAHRSFQTVTSGQALLAVHRILDSVSTGPLFLQRPEIAKVVVDALHYRDRHLRHYQLHSYVEMNPVKAGLAATPEEFQWSSAAG